MPRRIRFLLVLFLSFLIGTESNFITKSASTDLFFSEYIEGSSNNKALEIYNATGAAIDLEAGGYNVQMYFNGSASAGLTINLTGSLADGNVFVLAHASASPAILTQADQTNDAGWFNGNDVVVLRKGTTILDVIGQIGVDPGTEWGIGLTSTADNTLQRKANSCAGDPDGSNVFDPTIEWDGFVVDMVAGLGSHTANCSGTDAAPAVLSTVPADGAVEVPLNTSLTVTFSEPVIVNGSWFMLDCSVSGSVTATVSGGPISYTIDSVSDFIDGETCTLTIFAAAVSDQDSQDPPDTMSADFLLGFTAQDACSLPYTPIYTIQGSGDAAALNGSVTTQGVVVGDYEEPSGSGQLRGFYLQDATGDSDPATSDGIFVYNGNNNSVNTGDIVRLSGTAGEYQGQTQVSASSILKCGSGTVAPVDVSLPFSTASFPERYEGMLVRLPQTLVVTEHYQLGRFGQVVVSSGGRLYQPTSLVAPGPAADALQAANDLNRILIDDGTNIQNPDPILFGRNGSPLSAGNTLRAGDTATGIVGVLGYTWGGNSASPNAYRVRPINALNGFVNFAADNPRPSLPPPPQGSLRVASLNLLNFFNTFDGLPDTVDNCTNGVGGAATDCRGADDLFEFNRQWPKTVAAILETDADIIGIIEIENDGYGADSAIAFLVDQLNAASAPGTYAFIDVDSNTGQVNALGTDAIKVGLIYKPASVQPVGVTAVLNTVDFVNGGDATPRNRPSLAQAFEVPGGERMIISVNHLKSKGSPCDIPDSGDGQGECSVVRTNAAALLASWLAADPTQTGDPDVLVIGDLNAYAREDPLTAILSHGYMNLVLGNLGLGAYSYGFDGQWGYLDQALGSLSMAQQVAGVDIAHFNADEPNVLDYNTDFKSAGQVTSLYAPDAFRASDHDPILVDLTLEPVYFNFLPYLYR